MNAFDEDFYKFCRQATDSQLRNILRNEWDAYQHRDYASAQAAAVARGWTVHDGEVI